MHKQCTNQKESVKKWGPVISKTLQQRLREIEAMHCLGDLRTLPQARLHQLRGNRDNQFAVDLKHPYRLILEPHHDPIPLLEDGGFDLLNITAVLIIEVVDYHGK